MTEQQDTLKGIRAAMTSGQRWQHDQLLHQSKNGSAIKRDRAGMRLERFEAAAEKRQLQSHGAWSTMTDEQRARAIAETRAGRGAVGSGRFALPALQPVRNGRERATQQVEHEKFDVNQIKSSVDMRNLVQQYGVSVSREGKACCPAHSGGRSSATLHVYRDHVHCYHSGCGYTADAIRWVQDREDLDFVDACRVLTGQQPRVQGDAPRRQFEVTQLAPSEPEVVFEARPLAPLARAARDALWNAGTELAVEALEYMLSRGFDADELLAMGIGVIDNTVSNSLLPLNKNGKPSQMWRSRITIPGWVGDDCVSIKGRTLLPEPADNSDGMWRKYVNTAGSSTRPFGWSSELENDGADVILTEGELDYWTLSLLLPGVHVIAVPGLGNMNIDYAQRLAGRRVTLLIDGDTHVHDTTVGEHRNLDDDALKSIYAHSGPVIGGRRLARKLLEAGCDVHVAATGRDGDLNDLLRDLGPESALDVICSALSSARSLRPRRRMI